MCSFLTYRAGIKKEKKKEKEETERKKPQSIAV